MKELMKDIQASGLFDPEWYLKQYPDVKKSGIEPLTHYLKFGHRLNRRPSESLDISKYLKSNPDAIDSNINPLLHYIRYGEQNLTIAKNSDFKGKKASLVNEYFDNIYVVNLECKVADRLKTARHLEQNGIQFELFKATNGYFGQPLEHYEKYSSRPLGNLKRYSEYNQREIDQGSLFISSAGALGYIYTYVRILKDAKLKGYKRILILEDDIILANDFEERFRKFIASIELDWKVLQLGASQYGWSSVNFEEAIRKGYYFPRTMDTKGSFAIAFDISIIDEVIDALTSFEAPFDHAPMGEVYEKYLNKCFVAYPYLTIPDVSESSIRGTRCQFAHSKRMKWPLENFEYPLNTPSVAVIITSKSNLKYYEKFNKTSESPFRIRLYFNTIDGLRPLHNVELLDIESNRLIPFNENATVLQADYIVTLDEEEYLVESDLIEFLQSKLNLSKGKPKLVREIGGVKNDVVKDRVSVIIPTYKRPKNLKNALTSVVNQDYDNVEIIVISDNGHDSEFNNDTKDIIDSFKKSHPHKEIMFLEHRINRNGSAARNTGIANSTGEYISFLDDDDIYLQGRLSKSVNALKNKSNKIGAVYCGFLGWNSVENDLNRYKVGNLTYEILALDYLKHYLHTNTATYRREAILDINGFDESYRRHQDLEFNLRFFELYEIDAVKECLVQLNPEPSDVSNKVFEMTMLNLKQKFLGQFTYLIEQFSAEQQKAIFYKHQEESIKYVKDKSKALSVYQEDYKDYRTQIIIKLMDSFEPKSNTSFGNNLESVKNKDVGLYRIIGNNMPGLHAKEQSYDNLKFIIENEPDFGRIVKYFVLNRVIDNEVRSKIIDLLESKGYRYLEIDFDYQEFKKIGYDFDNLPDSEYWFGNRTPWQRLAANAAIRTSKNRYLMNNNGARNFALKHGRKRFEWTMPWDGNCFVTSPHYNELNQKLSDSTDYKYVITPMERLASNKDVNANTISTNPTEEPQISFSRDSIELFNEERVYGNQPKVELFKRIGAKGVWDEYVNLYPWKKLEFEKSAEFGMTDTSSAVFRLFSGNAAAIEAKNRTHTRAEGLADFIDEVEMIYLKENLSNIDNKKKFLSFLNKKILNLKPLRLNVAIGKVFTSGLTYKEKETELIRFIGDVYIAHKESKDFRVKLECSLIIFARNLNRNNKLLSKEVKSLLDTDISVIYMVDDLEVTENFSKYFSHQFVSMLLMLSLDNLQAAIKHKVELVLLMYFFYCNEMEVNSSLNDIFEIAKYILREFFEYDFDADFKNASPVLLSEMNKK